MNRSVDITLTEQDYVASQRLHFRAQLRSPALQRRIVLLLMIFVPLAGAVLHEIGLWDEAPLLMVALAILGPAIGIGASILMQLLLEPGRARRVFRQQKSLHGPITFSWSEAGLHTRSESGQSEFPWDHYWGWQQDAAIMLLYHSERIYQFIPKRVLSPEQAADLVAVMERQRSGAGAVAASSASIGSQR